MTRRLTIAVLLTACAALLVALSGSPARARAPRAGTPPATSCPSMTALTLPHTTITSATEVAASGSEPAYCNVQATVTNPPAGDHVHVGVFMPDAWNGRFEGSGGGGFVGGTPSAPDPPSIAQGFALAGTDTGHPGDGGNGAFALRPDGSPDRQLIDDFSFLGIHEMTVVAKAAIARYYGTGPRYSYFQGCSTGGRQGEMEAQRYPTDYNGIYAQSPAVDFARFTPAQLWGEVQMSVRHDFLPQCKFAAAQRAEIAACDPRDGLTDGIISDWAHCRFDARTLIGTVTPCGTITATDAAVIDAIERGPRGRDGRFLWYGLVPGTPYDGLDDTTTAADGTTTGAPFPVPVGYVQYWLARNPRYDWRTMTLAQFQRFFAQSVREYDATIGTADPNLSRFRAAGGKLIAWVGTADQLIPPQGSIAYYQRVIQRMGGLRATRRFDRFFIAPGVEHCGGGPGAAPTDGFSALLHWVEHGQAPQTLSGAVTDPTSGAVTMTRPVCPYGQVAAYDGVGPSSDASSFYCARAPVPRLPSAGG